MYSAYKSLIMMMMFVPLGFFNPTKLLIRMKISGILSLAVVIVVALLSIFVVKKIVKLANKS